MVGRAGVAHPVAGTDGGGRPLIPQGTVLTGGTRICGERMDIPASAGIQRHAVSLVELEVYDADGTSGESVPNSMEAMQKCEIAAGMGTSMGSSINISTDAGGADCLGRGQGVIHMGVSQYVEKKVR